MKLQWYGHSCFLMTAADGTRILTDPCAPKTGYNLHDIACDIITSSHGHYDHNYFEAAVGNPTVVNEAGEHDVHGIRMTAIPTFHDDEQGAKRGTNLIFVYEIDGLRIAHLGDLGHALSAETAAAIGKLDLLLCPVGGVFTIDAAGAAAVETLLDPQVFIPMHYKTPDLSFELGTVESFLALIPQRDVQLLGAAEWSVSKETLPEEKTAVVFDYAAC